MALSYIPLRRGQREIDHRRRKGSFPGLLAPRKFQVVWVNKTHPAGMESEQVQEVTVPYSGQAITVQLAGTASSK